MLIAIPTIVSLTWEKMLGKCPVFSWECVEIVGIPTWVPDIELGKTFCKISEEIVGIPTSVPDIELGKTFCKISDKVGVKINDKDIESCHRVGSQGRTIVKFSHRKDCWELMKVKKDLSKLNLINIDLGNTKIFINQSFCDIINYYGLKVNGCMQWSKFSYYVSNRTVEVKLEENCRPIQLRIQLTSPSISLA